MSYDEVERLDYSHSPSNEPVPPSIHSSIVIYGAMDNFGHEENTPSGILMLFQNPDSVI